MSPARADIIAQLEKEILPLQGFKHTSRAQDTIHLGPINNAFPNRQFPLAAIHEFMIPGPAERAATTGFIATILNKLAGKKAVIIWVSTGRTLFPPALAAFGVSPDNIIFIDLPSAKNLLWAIEEALKCEGLAAVIGEVNDLSFTASRRLQLIVEKSRVTGFIYRPCSDSTNPSACISRWRIKSLPGRIEDEMPGVGYPAWNIELLKIRNGTPGRWEMEWAKGKLRPCQQFNQPLDLPQRKTG